MRVIGCVAVWLCLFAALPVEVRAQKFTALTEEELKELKATCGVVNDDSIFKAADPQTHIIGGNVAKEKQFPWAVKVLRRDLKTETFTECSGTIISKKHVITAGHCLEFDKSGVLASARIDHLFVLAGSQCVHGLSDRPGLEECVDDAGKTFTFPVGKLFNASAVLIPESSKTQRKKYVEKSGFDMTLNFSDIAIIETSEELTSADGSIVPVCLAPPKSTHPKELVLYGYGSAQKNEPFNALLHYGNVVGETEEECSKNNKVKGMGCDRFVLTKRDAQSGPKHALSTCAGDDGGGLIAKTNNKSTLYAVFSAGISPCNQQSDAKDRPKSFSELSSLVKAHHALICHATGVCLEPKGGSVELYSVLSKGRSSRSGGTGSGEGKPDNSGAEGRPDNSSETVAPEGNRTGASVEGGNVTTDGDGAGAPGETTAVTLKGGGTEGSSKGGALGPGGTEGSSKGDVTTEGDRAGTTGEATTVPSGEGGAVTVVVGVTESTEGGGSVAAPTKPGRPGTSRWDILPTGSDPFSLTPEPRPEPTDDGSKGAASGLTSNMVLVVVSPFAGALLAFLAG